MRTLLEALTGSPTRSPCPRAIFLHLPKRGYAITTVEGCLFDDLEWHQTLEDACSAFFSESIDCTGVVFSEPHKWSPELQAAEWWPVAERPSGFKSQSMGGPWLRPFASTGGSGAPEPEPMRTDLVETPTTPPSGEPNHVVKRRECMAVEPSFDSWAARKDPIKPPASLPEGYDEEGT